MKGPTRFLIWGALLVPVAAATVTAQQDTVRAAQKSAAEPKQKNDSDPVADSIREARRREERMHAARNRPLFATSEPLKFTLIANYRALARDRDTLSTKRFAGTVIVNDASGAERRIPVRLRTRGHFRLMARNCGFVPLRIDFPDSGTAGTPFEGQRGLKLGSHCQNDWRYDRYTRREYLANRLYNVLTDVSLQVRMAQALYVDSASGKPVADRPALFFENEDELARRHGARIREWRGAVFDDLDMRTLLLMSMFEYGIGNTDWSIFALHNIRIAVLPNSTVLPFAYDFDFSGLVNAHYARPDPKMGIQTVRDRLYRGPCRPIEEVEEIATHIMSHKDSLYAEIAAVPGMDKDEQVQVREYFDQFLRTLSSPRELRQTFVTLCDPKRGV